MRTAVWVNQSHLDEVDQDRYDSEPGMQTVEVLDVVVMVELVRKKDTHNAQQNCNSLQSHVHCFLVPLVSTDCLVSNNSCTQKGFGQNLDIAQSS